MLATANDDVLWIAGLLIGIPLGLLLLWLWWHSIISSAVERGVLRAWERIRKEREGTPPP